MANENRITIVIHADGTAAIESIGRTGKSVDGLKREFRDAQVQADRLNAGSRDLTDRIGRLAAQFVTLGAAMATLKAGLNYLAQIETATLGIAAAFMTGGRYIDRTTGKALEGEAALRAAQAESAQLVEELKFANLQTIATLDQLIVAYQQTLPVAIAKGFDKRQVKEFTVAMVQAAGAIGLPMDQLGEETRSLLTGSINPRNSRIATVLGLRSEDIAEYRGNATALFDFLMQKLDAYRTAGVAAQNTWAGLWSNTKDIALQYLGQGLTPLFETVKYELQAITSEVVTLDEKTRTIRWNPAFVDGLKSMKDGVVSVIAEMYRLGMFVDKIGASLTRLWFGISFGAVRSGGEAVYRKNEELRERYMRSEKALQDLAMREVGWKPVTAEADRKMREAALAGRKLYEQTKVNVGNPDEGTQRLLRYYREIGREAAAWTGNAPPSGDEGAAKKANDRARTMADLRAREAVLNRSTQEAALRDLQHRHDEELKKLRGLHATKGQIAEAERLQGAETTALEAAQADERARILADYRDRESLLGREKDEAERIRMAARHREEAEKLEKLTNDKALLEEAARVRKLEADDLVRRQTLERDNALALAQAQAAQSSLQSRLEAEQKLDDSRRQAGTLTEEDAVTRRYDRERRLLEAEISTLEVQYDQEKVDARKLELSARMETALLKILDLEAYKAYELDRIALANQEKMIALREKERDLLLRNYDSAWQFVMDQANRIGGGVGEGVGQAASGLKGITDVAMGQDPYSRDFEAYREILLEKEEISRLFNEQELQRIRERGSAEADLLLRNGLVKAGMYDQLQRYELAKEKTLSNQKASIVSNTFGMMAGAGKAFYEASNKQSELAFKAYQAFSIAQAIVATYLAADKALSEVPYPYNYVVMAATIAAGLANVATIASASPGGSAAGTSPSAPSAGGYGYYDSAGSSWTAEPWRRSGPWS